MDLMLEIYDVLDSWNQSWSQNEDMFHLKERKPVRALMIWPGGTKK